MLWRSGPPTVLSTANKDGAATSVFVAGSDVYVAGYEFNGTNYVATLWKNGAAAPALTNGTTYSSASAVFVIVQ